MANLTVTKRAPATVTNIGTVAARRRMNGRTKLQQEQKESSRQSLLDAAQRLYVEESYAAPHSTATSTASWRSPTRCSSRR
jgi:hypothetical protein